MNLVDVECVGKLSVFQNDKSKFDECAQQIEDYLIGIEPHFEAMLTWDLETETEIRARFIAGKVGENGDPAEQVDGYAQQPKTVQTHLTEGESRSIAQNCGRNGLEATFGTIKLVVDVE